MAFNWSSIVSGLGSAIGNMFGGSGNSSGGGGNNAMNSFTSSGQSVPSQLSPSQLSYQNSMSTGSNAGGGLSSLFKGILGGSSNNGQSSGGSGASGLINNLFNKNNSTTSGIGSLFASQLIQNPKTPALPQSFYDFQNQANSGGPPLQQQGNQYLSTLLSGQNTDANDAATHSLDLNYEEQLRQLNGMYKSLRPGTDPLSDTTYARDLQNLNDAHARQRAQVLAQQQLGASGQALGYGQAQSGQQQAAIETQVQQIAAQWGLDAEKTATLRNMLMQLGGNTAQAGIFSNLFPNANPYQTRAA